MAADSDKGWFMQMASNYVHASDPNRAREMQRKTFEWNRYLFRPAAGVRYQKMIAKAEPQAQNTLAWAQTHTDPSAITISAEALVNNLVFGVSHARFEEAWAEIGTILGFKSERPEEELGKGPGGLWAMPENHYLPTEIGALLASHRLDAGSIRTNYSVPVKRSHDPDHRYGSLVAS